ncbi:MAG: hypothetical protein EZS28_015097 [Streblomastix strix]|uniref:Uncharacterized protein n=1 Tax=Streblomastix strix TaxID=222440 RepID=A0A5J4W307_9EUKA|nr:MAG: hypothetical protein EZS28_015097 [Streblomastix strix]
MRCVHIINVTLQQSFLNVPMERKRLTSIRQMNERQYARRRSCFSGKKKFLALKSIRKARTQVYAMITLKMTQKRHYLRFQFKELVQRLQLYQFKVTFKRLRDSFLLVIMMPRLLLVILPNVET